MSSPVSEPFVSLYVCDSSCRFAPPLSFLLSDHILALNFSNNCFLVPVLFLKGKDHNSQIQKVNFERLNYTFFIQKSVKF